MTEDKLILTFIIALAVVAITLIIGIATYNTLSGARACRDACAGKVAKWADHSCAAPEICECETSR